MEEIIRLRGHHLLCLLGFRGLGYNQEFVENMTRVHSRVFSSSGCLVELVDGPDDICKACPRLAEGKCQVNKKDNIVLEKALLQVGDHLTAEKVYQRIAKSFTPEDISNICSKCRWRSLGYCEEGLKKLIYAGNND